jgi:lysophospholipase L1-like esterase
MHILQKNTCFRWIWRSLLIIALFSSIGCSSNALQKSSLPALAQALPGLQIWKQGVSSFLFGANDTQEWSQNNVETSPAIQQALKVAHFSLMRTFFFDKSLADGHPTTDAEIEQRLKTVENSGMACLGVLQNISNVEFDKHVVTRAGSRCQLYEFGNEPDYNGISIETYLKQWNNTIPLLRKINPNAKFIGPVTYNNQGNKGFMRAFLEGVKASGVLPDAVSFHWYPCYQDTQESCLNKASSYGQAAEGVRALVREILGKDIPVGITEWNYDPGNPPPAYGDNPNFISKFTTDALHSMALAGVAFACQFDIASYGGYGRLDMFNIDTNQPKPQYYAIKNLIQFYRLSNTPVQAVSTPVTMLSPTAASVTNSGPLISRGKPVFCYGNDAGAGGQGAIVNGHYGDWSFWRPSISTLPSWCAIHVGTGPTQLLMTWESDYIFDYISNTGSGPQDYSMAVSSDSTNGADGTWRTVVMVTGNHTRVREHLLPFAGQSWVKMTITKGQTQASQPYVFIDQIDLYDVSTSLNDTFFFSGDSITAIAFDRFDANQPSFAEIVHASYPQRFPTMLDGGLGGWNSDGAVQDIDLWLTLNPDIHYWLLGWGTNDAFDNVSPNHFRANLQTLVDKIKLAGHVPILAHIPYIAGKNLEQEVQSLNAVIDQIMAANGLIRGPDFYQLFLTHKTTYFLPDGIHPNAEGAKAMNLAWFQVLRPILYQ